MAELISLPVKEDQTGLLNGSDTAIMDAKTVGQGIAILATNIAPHRRFSFTPVLSTSQTRGFVLPT